MSHLRVGIGKSTKQIFLENTRLDSDRNVTKWYFLSIPQIDSLIECLEEAKKYYLMEEGPFWYVKDC